MSDKDKKQAIIDNYIALNAQRDAEALAETVKIRADGPGVEMTADDALDAIDNVGRRDE